MQWLAAISFFVFGILIYFADRGIMPGGIGCLASIPGWDKAGHLLLIGLLAFLVNLGFSGRTVVLLSRKILLGSLITFLVVTLEEISQLFFPLRTFSLVDLSFDYLGIVIASFFSGYKAGR